MYQRDDKMLADEAFESGEYRHLVIGNKGRLLDTRRTPVSIIKLRMADGMFVLRIDAFEDEGAIWEIPFEKVGNYQFTRGSDYNNQRTQSQIERIVDKFNQRLAIDCKKEVRDTTWMQLQKLKGDAIGWINKNSRFQEANKELPNPIALPECPLLWEDLKAFMETRAVWDIEEAFARQFVSNPYSGELVKGHRIVLAQLGLVPFKGKIVRDPDLFAGEWSSEKRAQHILSRMAFITALFSHYGYQTVKLYRGISSQSHLRAHANYSFVSTSFNQSVAEAHYQSGNENSTCVLYRQSVPIERLFMTFYETEQMNRQFREAEAILFYECDNLAF